MAIVKRALLLVAAAAAALTLVAATEVTTPAAAEPAAPAAAADTAVDTAVHDYYKPHHYKPHCYKVPIYKYKSYQVKVPKFIHKRVCKKYPKPCHDYPSYKKLVTSGKMVEGEAPAEKVVNDGAEGVEKVAADDASLEGVTDRAYSYDDGNGKEGYDDEEEEDEDKEEGYEDDKHDEDDDNGYDSHKKICYYHKCFDKKHVIYHYITKYKKVFVGYKKVCKPYKY